MSGRSFLGALRHAGHHSTQSRPMRLTSPSTTKRTFTTRRPFTHIHIDCSPHEGLWPSYAYAAQIQERLTRVLLDYKASAVSNKNPDEQAPPPPHFLLTFIPRPTYTLGRRDSLESLGEEQVNRLKAPLTVRVGTKRFTFVPDIVPTLRGGQTTYHGPGQLVAWPIMDLHSPSPWQRLPSGVTTVKGYADALQRATDQFVKDVFDVKAAVCDPENPGVWVKKPDHPSLYKIASMGVHLRRHVTGAGGVAVNIITPTLDLRRDSTILTKKFIPGAPLGANIHITEQSNPWTRFVPCGIPDRGVTCVQDMKQDDNEKLMAMVKKWRWPRRVAVEFAKILAGQFGYEPTEIETQYYDHMVGPSSSPRGAMYPARRYVRRLLKVW